MPNLLNLLKQQAVLKGDEGVGDTIKRVTESIGIKPCGKCEERRKRLNEKYSYKKEEL